MRVQVESPRANAPAAARIEDGAIHGHIDCQAKRAHVRRQGRGGGGVRGSVVRARLDVRAAVDDDVASAGASD